MVFTGPGRHRRPSQTERAVAAATVAGAGLALPLLAATGAHAAPASSWDTVAQCESNGNWTADTGDGFYGGLHLTQRQWDYYGGDEYGAEPSHATRQQQIKVAEAVLEDQGPGVWGSCATTAGLTAPGGAQNGPGTPSTPGTPSAPAPTQTTPGTPGTPGTPTTPAPDPTASAPTVPAAPSTPVSPVLPVVPAPSAPAGAAPSTPVTPSTPAVPAPTQATTGTAAPGTPAQAGTPAPTAPAPTTAPQSPAPQSPAPQSLAPQTPTPQSPAPQPGIPQQPVAGLPTAGTPAPGTPAQPAQPSPSSQPATGDYTVQPGDCLSEIAYTHHLDGWQQFYQHNAEVVGADPNLILPGQHLQFP